MVRGIGFDNQFAGHKRVKISADLGAAISYEYGPQTGKGELKKAMPVPGSV